MAPEARREAAERHTLRVIGGGFLLLAAYVSYDAVRALVERRAPEHSTIGIVVAALSLVAAARSRPKRAKHESVPTCRRSSLSLIAKEGVVSVSLTRHVRALYPHGV